jgi:amino acid adenylation domain-containing protein
LKDCIGQQSNQEGELLVSPGYFMALREQDERISEVEVLIKRGRAVNELTQFRYEVVLHVGGPVVEVPEAVRMEWTDKTSVTDLESRLGSGEKQALEVRGIPNTRLAEAVRIGQLLEEEELPETVGTLNEQVKSAQESAVEPEALWSLAERFGYALSLSYSQGGAGLMDALFQRPPQGHGHVPARALYYRNGQEPLQELNRYTNNPLLVNQQRDLVPKLRDYLKEQLPDHMVPSALMVLDALPLTPNGKVDRRALPRPEQTRDELSGEYVAPRNETEEQLVEIWEEVLKVDRVGVHDNFFDLGGHSLMATQVVSRIRDDFETALPLAMMFDSPTIAGLTKQIEPHLESVKQSSGPPIVPVPRDRPLPLSFAQQRLWFVDMMIQEGSPYNMKMMQRLEGNLDRCALQKALDQLVLRHESLRTVFKVFDIEPVQVILEPRRVELSVTVLSHLPEEEGRQEASRLAQQEANKPYDLSADLMIRAQLLEMGEQDHILLLTLHHIASDGWSLGIVYQELAKLYQAFSQNKPYHLPELPIQYADFAAWQREWLQGDELERQLDYWRKQLTGLATLALPLDHPRSARRSYRGDVLTRILPSKLSMEIKRLNQQEDVTLFMTMLAAFALMLHRYAGQDDIVVGSPIANRNRSEIEGLIGFFVNTLAMRTELSGDPSFHELLRDVRKMSLDAYSHQDLPFEKLVDELVTERDPSMNPLVQVLFQMQNVLTEKMQLSELKLESLNLGEEKSVVFDLEVMVMEHSEGLVVMFLYSAELFEPSTIHRMMNHYQNLLEAAVLDPQKKVSQLPLMSPDECRQILVDWNQTSVEFPDDKCVHELFEAQAARTPDAQAVCFEKQQLSYAELNARANQLAHYLRSLGVGPGTLVGICVERSPEMIIGVLSVLKAGGAYVPLDPRYPKDRLAYMLDDSQAPVLLTQHHLMEDLPETQAELVWLDKEWPVIAKMNESNLNRKAAPDDLAYIIYTSGSTGRPKGVMIIHRSLCNRLHPGQPPCSMTGTDGILQIASLSFDVAAWEIFAPLLSGARLVLARPGYESDINYLIRLIIERQITVANFVPSLLHIFLEAHEVEKCNQCIKHVLCGGEALSLELRDRFLSQMTACLHNFYGPTETTIDATYWTCSRESHPDRVPIGRPIPNTNTYILDSNLQPAPIGVCGELYIGGVGLAAGYLNQDRLTAERFISHPFKGDPGARLYKTGDRARYLPDGNIEFIGRVDQQLKIRGFRIEPGEIETAIKRHQRVRDAVVVSLESRGANHGQINGILETTGGVETLSRAISQLGAGEAGQLLNEIEGMSENEVEFLMTCENNSQERRHVMIRRYPEFENYLRIRDDQFIRPPMENQRNWLLQMALNEFSDDLHHLHEVSKRFVTGSERPEIQNEWTRSDAQYDPSQLIIEGQQVMQAWETPMMKAMADIVGQTHGDILEVGFGMGVSATHIQEHDIRSYTIIECNEHVIAKYEKWKEHYPNRAICLIQGKWQDVTEQLGSYDGVFFDTYASDEAEYLQDILTNITFAEPFFSTAASVLRPGGVFTYYTNEIDTFSRRHQRLLFKYFRSFELSVVKSLKPPDDCNYWWADSMVVVKAVK